MTLLARPYMRTRILLPTDGTETLYLPMWYPPLGGSPTALKDMSRTNVNWTRTGSIWGYQGRIMDGDDKFVTSATLDTISAMSVGTGSMMLWMKPTGAAASVVINTYDLPGSGDNNGSLGIARGIITTPDPDEDRIWFYGYDTAQRQVGLAYTVSQWYCAGWVHTGGTLYAYLYDPLTKVVTTGSVALANLATVATLMQIGKTVSAFFTGTKGEFKMFARALTQTEFTRKAQETEWRYLS